MNSSSRLLILVLLCSTLLSSCAIIRGLSYGRPDKKDILRFPFTTISAGVDCFEFEENLEVGAKLKVSDWSHGTPLFVTLNELATSRPVRSFVVIQRDTVLYHFNGQGTDESDLHPSYSMAKSYTSALVGIAISEGKIGSVDDKVSKYLSEFETIEGAENLKVEHLLNMTSGIKHKPKIDAILYYGNDVSATIRDIEFAYAPGTRQEYLNINVQLLGLILHRTSGMKPAEYLRQKIWKPIQSCNNAIWTEDRRGENLTFCCMGATALDYAKLGRLFLNKGNWNGKQVVPEDWVNRSVRRDTTEGSAFNYNYLWHIGEAAYGDYMADGMYKQHIYVQPEKEIIIVLTCNRDNKLASERVRWRHVFRQIVDQL